MMSAAQIKKTSNQTASAVGRCRRWRRKLASEGGDKSIRPLGAQEHERPLYERCPCDEEQRKVQQQQRHELQWDGRHKSREDSRQLPSRLNQDTDGARTLALASPLSPIRHLELGRAKSLEMMTPKFSLKSLALALVYHIVIISLILHNLSSGRGQALAASSAHGERREVQSAAMMRRVNNNNLLEQKSRSFIADQNNGERQSAANGNDREINDNDRISSNESGRVSFMKAAARDCRDKVERGDAALSAQRRQKRHLVASSFGATPEFEWRADGKRSAGGAGSPAATPECRRLATFWAFLRASYPALSAHLLQWAAPADGGRASDEQFLLARSGQSARALAHLLEDAERTVASAGRPSPAGRIGGQQRAAWLARVSSSPSYARLVQHLLARQQQQQRGSPNQWSRAAEATRAPADDEPDQTVAASTSVSQQPVYGRLVHFPHEIGGSENASGMARTLDKLRLLSQHARQQQQAARDIESNRIPALEQAEANWRRPGDLVDSARNNFVFGEVLLQPQQSGADLDFQPARPDPMGALRALADEQQTAGGRAGGRAHGGPSPSLQADSFGRIITSPPSRSGSNQEQQMRADDNNNDVHLNFRKPHEPDERAPTPDEAASDNLAAADELASQQRFQQAALSDEPGVSAGEDEFEGVFHAGPLQQVEVRRLRSLDHKSGQGLVEIVAMPSSTAAPKLSAAGID